MAASITRISPVGARFPTLVRSPVRTISTRLALEPPPSSHRWFAPGSQPPLRANRRPRADLSRQSRKTPVWRPGVTVIQSYGWRLKVSTMVSTISSGFFWKPANRTAYCSSGRSERFPPLGKHPMNERNSRDLGWWTQHSVVLLPRPSAVATLTTL